MNKVIKTMFALAICAVPTLFSSCSKDDDNTISQSEIESKIIGGWKSTKYDGKDVLTNGRNIFTFQSGGKGTISMSIFYPEEYDMDSLVWLNKLNVSYAVKDQNVHITLPKTTINWSVYSCKDDQMSISLKINAGDKSGEYSMLFSKVTADYSKDIIGLWEGVEMTGYETYGDANHRIEYKADGTYIYYNKSGDEWVVSANAGNEWNVDGDWLATRWRAEAGSAYNYEWWDIDYIKDGVMKWSALRAKEDGTRFTTTFTWMKVQ